MLIRFEVANFRSVLEPAELSLVAVDRDRVEARHVPGLNESLLAVAAIYGPNASGKSNVLAAFEWLRSAVQDSLRSWDEEIPIEPFAFAGRSEHLSVFTIESIVDGVRFEYVVELDRNSVRYEGLFHYPEKKRRRVFEREGGELKIQRGLGGISGTRELLTDRTLALSAARRFDEPLVSHYARDLLSMQTWGVSRFRRTPLPAVPGPRSRRTANWFEDVNDDQASALDLVGSGEPSRADRDQALALLRMADLGIDDVVIDTQEVVYAGGGGESQSRARRRVRLLHTVGSERVPLDLAAESEGTRTWYNLIGPVLSVLRSGSCMLFDELDASLHPVLSAQLIRLFHDPATNPLGAQLVFASHDTSLLDHLNRDEVWLTEKDDHGATTLGALAEFAGERVRRSQNLEKAYLHGRFGALPDVDRTEMLRSLGLIG